MFLFHAAWGMTNVTDRFTSELLPVVTDSGLLHITSHRHKLTVNEQGTYAAMHKGCDNSAHEQVKLLCMNLLNKEGLLYNLLKEETFLNVIFNI